MKPNAYITILFAATAAFGQVNVFEGDVFPEVLGWERVMFLECDRVLDSGWFRQKCLLGESPGPMGERDLYQRAIAEFVDTPTFFVEWRAVTDVPSDLFDVSGVATALSVTGTRGVKYHFTLTDERVRLIRDNFLPIVYADIDAKTAHTYRLELYGAEVYVWYIDGHVIDSGVPEGAYPDVTSFMIWGASHNVYDDITRWDYVRYGVIPVDGSGDFDSNETVDLFDYYFAHECLTNKRPGINGGPDMDAGPGCRFTDFDSDNDVDLRDMADFQNQFGQAP